MKFLGHSQGGQPSCTFLQRPQKCYYAVLNQLNSVFSRALIKGLAEFHIHEANKSAAW